MSKKNDYNIVNFSQTTLTNFYNTAPTSYELKIFLYYDVHTVLSNYLKDLYFTDYYPLLKEMSNDHQVVKGKEQAFITNLFWWYLLYHIDEFHADYIEDFIHKQKDIDKSPFILSWLDEWKKAVPSFYFVGYKYDDQNFVLIDSRTRESFDVMIFDLDIASLEKGDIVLGTLLPIGDELYFPITEFYRFHSSANEDVAQAIYHSFDEISKNSTQLQAFIHIVSIALQIEEMIIK